MTKGVRMDANQARILFGNAKKQESSVLVNQYVGIHIKLAMKFVTLENQKDVKNARRFQMDGNVQEMSKQKLVNVVKLLLLFLKHWQLVLLKQQKQQQSLGVQ